MRFHFVCYSDQKFLEEQKLLANEVSSYNEFDSVTCYTSKWLATTEFYSCHKNLLDEPRGAGWCAWKPYVIKTKMAEIPESDVVVYLDSADTMKPGITDFLKSVLETQDCLLLGGSEKNSSWTKRDTFIAMKCDEPKFWEARQLEAGFQSWKKCKTSEDNLQLYLEWCCNRNVVTDEVFFQENFSDYKDHRYDQSILTNLAIKFDLPIDYSFSLIRRFVTCNVRG